jgi:hypothetical protein
MATDDPPTEPLTGWQRLGRLGGYAFRRQEPSEEVRQLRRCRLCLHFFIMLP